MRTSGSPFWRMIFTQKFVRAASLLPYTFPTEIIDSWQPFLKPSKRNSQTHISGVETMHEKLWPWTIYLSLSFFFFEEITNNRVCHQEAASPTPAHEAGWAQERAPPTWFSPLSTSPAQTQILCWAWACTHDRRGSQADHVSCLRNKWLVRMRADSVFCSAAWERLDTPAYLPRYKFWQASHFIE